MLKKIYKTIEHSKKQAFATLSLLAICFNLILLGHSFSSSQDLENPKEFIKEKVVISLSQKEAKVEGSYSFYNTSEKAQRINILYPFPRDNNYPYPHSIEVWELNSDSTEKLPWAKGTYDICWEIRFSPKQTKRIKVEYDQRIETKSFKYILTSTEKWEKPLKESNLIVQVPTYFKNVQLSYPVQRIEKKKSLIYYSINKKDFMPQKDLIVNWD